MINLRIDYGNHTIIWEKAGVFSHSLSAHRSFVVVKMLRDATMTGSVKLQRGADRHLEGQKRAVLFAVGMLRLRVAALAVFGTLGSLPTFAALANEISVKPEGERRHCGLFCRSPPTHHLSLRQRSTRERGRIADFRRKSEIERAARRKLTLRASTSFFLSCKRSEGRQ